MIKTITIIGGGFASWYTAATLKHNCPTISVTVIDSDKHPRLGVGETLGWSSPYDWKRNLGLNDDRELMWNTGATYKYGTNTNNFWRDDAVYSYGKFFNLKVGSLTKFYGEFDYPEFYEPWSKKPGDVGLHHAWMSINQNTDKNFNDYIQEINENEHFVKNNLAPYDADNRYQLRSAEGWSYHIDAEQTVQFLKRLSFKDNNNIHHISVPVASAELDQSGQIACLILEDGQKIQSDLYIDATGFSRVITKMANNPTWKSLKGDYCDSAWVCPTQYLDPETEMKGGTVLSGEEEGWRFRVDLYHRSGNGHIFNSHITDQQIPLDTMTRITEGRRLADPRLITWDPGYYDQCWYNNVISIGISGNFIDPYDAPSFDIHSRALEDLVKCLDGSSFQESRDRFNKAQQVVVEERRIRLLLTFGLSSRTGKFWDTRRELLKSNHGFEILKDVINERKTDIEHRLPHFWHQVYFRMIVAAELDRKNFAGVKLSDADRIMAEAFFQYNRQRNEYIRQRPWPNYYRWIKENRFNNESSSDSLKRLNPALAHNAKPVVDQ